MATVTVTQPEKGSTSTTNPSKSSYTVRWDSLGSGATFQGFRVICHYCEQTLYSSSSNPATFNLLSLENSGHPGPFEIITDIDNSEPEDSYLFIETTPVGHGTTSPTYQMYSRSGAGSIRFSIDATPDSGYRFKEWRRGSASGSVVSTNAHYSGSSSVPEGGQAYIHFYAIFEDASLIPVVGNVCYPRSLSAQIGGVWHYGVRLDSDSSNDTKNVYAWHNAGSGDTRDYLAGLTTSPAFKGKNTGVIYPAQTLSISFGVSDAAKYAAFGLCVDHVEVIEIENDSIVRATTYDGGDGSVNVSHTVLAELDGGIESARVEVTVYLVSTQTYRQVVFTVIGDPACVPYISGVQKDRWLNDITVTRYAGDGEHSVSIWSLVNKDVHFGGNFPVREGAFVHGWSMQVSGSGNNRYIRITEIGPAIYITVYICTHLLVCTDDGLHLECKPPELLCDCTVPPNTTVYP